MVQVGYIDSTGFVYEQIDFGNRQFGPTLDTVYGEKYTGTVVLPTSLMLIMTELMPNTFDNAVVQMVIFKEDGVDIDVPIPLITPFSRKPLYLQQRADDAAQPGAVDVQSVQTPVAKPVNRNAFAGYFPSSDQPPILPIKRLESTLVINQSAEGAAFVMTFTFAQDIDIITCGFAIIATPAVYGGPYAIAVNIYNALLVTLTAGAPYVQVLKDTVASLQIPPYQISNFPVDIGSSYTLIVNQTDDSLLRTTYEFIVNNDTNNTSVNLGTAVFDNNSAHNISGNKMSQSIQYNGPEACADTPQTISTWNYPILNGVPNSTKYNQFFPQNNQCGTFLVEPNEPSGPTVITYPAPAPPA